MLPARGSGGQRGIPPAGLHPLLAAAYPVVDAIADELRSQGRNPVVFNRIPSFFGYGPTVAYLEATPDLAVTPERVDGL